MMRPAQVPILMALLASGICGYIVTKQKTPEVRLYFEAIKSQTKDVYSAIKSKLGLARSDNECLEAEEDRI